MESGVSGLLQNRKDTLLQHAFCNSLQGAFVLVQRERVSAGDYGSHREGRVDEDGTKPIKSS